MSNVLLLCHAKNHKYEFLKLNFSKKAKKFKTLDVGGKPHYKTDITQPISIKERFQIITSVYCPFTIYDSEQAFKNIYDLLAPGGLFMTKFGGINAPIIKLSDKQKEKYDIPISYNSPNITKYFNVIYLCQRKIGNSDGYIYTNKNNKTAYANMSIPECLIKTCSVFDVDIIKWIKYNHMEIIVMQKI